mgnify:CR=1 FL=1
MSIISIYNIKGGVGKTATAVNISYLASLESQPVVICDMDPQASASFYFRIKPKKKFNSKRLIAAGKDIFDYVRGTDFEYLDLLPADFSYRKLDIKLNEEKKSDKKLRDILKPLTKEYKYIFLDAPPNITLFSENIFNASDYILVPLIPTTLSIRTFEQLMDFFKKKNYPKEKIIPFFSMVDRRKNMHKEFIENAKKQKAKFLNTYIPFSSSVEKMGITREPSVHTEPNSAISKEYKVMWQEIKELIN